MKEKCFLKLLEKEEREVCLFNDAWEKLRDVDQELSEAEERELGWELLMRVMDAEKRVSSARRDIRDYIHNVLDT